jgi:hypothetical protein
MEVPAFVTAVGGIIATAVAKEVLGPYVSRFFNRHFGPNARLRHAEEEAKRTASAAPPVAALWPTSGPVAGTAPVHMADMQLLVAREVELRSLRSECEAAQRAASDMRHRLEQANIDRARSEATVAEQQKTIEQLGRLREAHDQLVREHAHKNGELAAERERNLRLVAENTRLRTEGGDGRPTGSTRLITKHEVNPRHQVERVRGTNPKGTRGADS